MSVTNMATNPKRINWTIPELKLAFYLYCQLPFGKLHRGNPLVIQLADTIGRTPSAVAMKLVNFASLDPFIRSTGRHGFMNASKLDQEIWDEFHDNWDALTIECAQYFENNKPLFAEDEIIWQTPKDTTRATIVNVRVGQNFFRRAVLASYSGKCCMSNTAIPELLIASHIIPWNVEVKERLNPGNGLCLSAIHDMAFDKGFITVFPDYTIGVSKQIKTTEVLLNAPIIQHLSQLEGRKINLPEKFIPSPEFLEWHNQNIFRG